ncbi:hypothetical protein [Streptomyces sp. NPDC059009]|uniref:hypothetical protein n=1 Tax=Streptomyces sp. NPDC059009 TaxID=3346694 RepID=UPI003691C7D7
MGITTFKRAAVTGLSLLALTLPAAVAQAATTAPAASCERYQATVDRHQEALDKMEKRIELLRDDYQDADNEAEYAYVNYYEWRDAALLDELSDDEKADAQKRSEEFRAQYKEAEARSMEIRKELDAAENDPELKKTASLLKRAKTRLATCQANNG